MSTDISTFVFPVSNHEVRSLIIDGEPWFVAKDVAAVLGYANPTRDVTRHTNERQRKQYQIGTGASNVTGTGERLMNVVSEPGVYRLVMRSNLPAAERFQDWLAEEVIPSIRKTGRYAVTMSPREIAQLVIVEANRADLAEERLAIAAPKIEIYDEWMETGHHINMKTFAKRIAFAGSASALCKALRDVGVFVGYRVPVGGYQDWANFPTEPWAEYFVIFNTRIKQGVYRDTAFILPPGQVLVWKELRRHGYDVQRPIID